MGSFPWFGRADRRAKPNLSRRPILVECLEDRQLLAASPYLSAAPIISAVQPTIIEAEYYDRGGEGVAYADLDPRQSLTLFRPEDRVDFALGTSIDGGEGNSVTSFQPGEWMGYTIDVPTHGHYDIVAKVSSAALVGNVGGYFHFEFGAVGDINDHSEKSPLVVVPGTNGIGAWTEVRVRGVHLEEGLQWMKIVSDFGNVTIDSIRIEPESISHVGDSMSAEEHMALDHLLPANEATHVAVRSGNLTDPGTWAFGSIPSAHAAVWIPEGVAVVFDVPANFFTAQPIQSIRVDGKFSFATDRSTILAVDTIVVTKTGSYEQGTADNPIQGGITSQVYFTDFNPIDREQDPFELGRGLISHGAASIVGEEKTTFAELAVAPARGSTSITLSAAPTNWKVGDQIVIAGVRIRYLPSNQTFWPTEDTSYSPQIATEDEVVTITSINGATVKFNRALTYDHIPPAGATDTAGRALRVSVANLTRSITYQSTNMDYSNNEQMHRHGHVMFMHSDNVTVNFAAFNDLGRTNKGLRIDDLGIEASNDSADPFTNGTGANVRGRYALHFHQTGVNRDATAIMVRGNSIRGGTGWGYVNHGGYVNFCENVAYDVPGAAYVEEDGRGIGAFRRNIAIRSVGTGRPDAFNEDSQLRDVGFSGHGFFFRGNIADAEDNIAVSIAHSAYAWSNKGDSRLPINDLMVPASSLHDPELALGGDSILWEAAPTKVFRRNVAIASGMAIGASFWMGPDIQDHDGRSEIRDFTGWNLAGTVGTLIHYTRRLTIINMKLTRDASLGGRGLYGIQADTNATGDHVYDGVSVSGYDYGLYSVPFATGGQPQRFIILDNSNLTTGNGQAYHPSAVVIPFAKSALNRSALNFTGTAQAIPKEGNLGHGVYVTGTKVDSIGTEVIGGAGSSTARFYLRTDQIRDIVARGYFSDASGTYVMIPILVTDRATLLTKVVYVRSAFNPADFVTIPVGPNLGAWAGASGKPVSRINVGGAAAGGMSADAYYSGGSVISTTADIESATRYGASPSVYRDARVGASTYTFNVTPNSVFTVRLHFAEIVKDGLGQRLFDVRINGETVLKNFDVRVAAGGKNRAIVNQFEVLSSATGQIVIEFVQGSVDLPIISAIEVVTQVAQLVTPGAVPSVPAGSYVMPFVLAIASPVHGATIYYTTDGSTPTTASARYTQPIQISQTTTVRTLTVALGRTNSAVSSWTYTLNSASTPYRLNLGGPSISGFAADLYSVGYLKSIQHTRSVSNGVAGAAPREVYQSATTISSGSEFWLILPNLEADKTYTVRLHFSEPTYSQIGDRRFDTWINGTKVLNEFDVVSAALGMDRAVVVDFTVQADLLGRIYVYFQNGSTGTLSNTPFLNGLEIIDPNP